MTHDQYLDEPREVVDWALALGRLDQEVEKEAIEKEAAKRR